MSQGIPYIPEIKSGDWASVQEANKVTAKALRKLSAFLLGPNANPTFSSLNVTDIISSNLTIDTLSGVLKASSGVVSGSATLDDVSDGTSYKRVAANQLSSGVYINATTTTKGIASFNSSNFSVTDGVVSLASGGGGLSHNDLSGLQGGASGEYYHLTSAQVSNLHVPITLGTANGLTLSEQELSLPTSAEPQLQGLTVLKESSSAIVLLQTYCDSSNGCSFNGYHYRGTVASPTTVQNDDRLYQIAGGGYSAAAGNVILAGAVRVYADGEWDTSGDASDAPGRLSFWTTPDGSDTLTERMRIDNRGLVLIGKTTGSEKLEVAGKIRADTAFNLNGSDVITTTSGLTHGIFSGGMTVGSNKSVIAGGIQFARASTAEPFIVLQNDGGNNNLAQWRGVDGGGCRWTNGASSVEWMKLSSTGDLSVDTDTLYIDATNHRVGINTSTPGYQFEIIADSDTSFACHRNSSRLYYTLYTYSNTASHCPHFTMSHYRGSKASPGNTVNGDILGILNFQGYYGAAKNSAQIVGFADGEWGTGGYTTDCPGGLSFWTTPDGSDTLTEKMRITNGGSILIGKTSGSEKLEVAGKIRADTAFNLNGTDGVTQASSAGKICDVTALAGGIATAQTQVTPIADGVHSLSGITSITTVNGRITAMS